MDLDSALAKARSLSADGDRTGAVSALEAAIAASPGADPGALGECRLELGWIVFGDGDYRRVMDLALQSSRELEQAGQTGRRGAAVHLAACAAAMIAPEQEMPLLREALTLLDEDHPDEILSCHRLLAQRLRGLGLLDEAERQLQQALPLVRKSASRFAKSDVLMALARIQIERDRAAHAMALVDAAREHLTTVRQRLARLREAECLELLGDARLQKGDQEGALANYREALEQMRTLEAGGARRLEQKIVALSAR